MRNLLSLIALFAVLIPGPPGQAASYSAAARQVLAQARAASGGVAWNYLRGWHETGRRTSSMGGDIAYEAWRDPLRYGYRIETREPQGLRVHAFNGAADWEIAPDGAISGAHDTASMTDARTESFFAVSGYFYPARFESHGELIGVRSLRGKSFDVVRVQPQGGHARELWFDRRTHLLARMVDRSGPRPLTLELSDYRKVGPLMVAFHTSLDEGSAAGARQVTVEAMAFTPADRALFSLPPPTPATVATPAPAAPPAVKRPLPGSRRHTGH